MCMFPKNNFIFSYVSSTAGKDACENLIIHPAVNLLY